MTIDALQCNEKQSTLGGCMLFSYSCTTFRAFFQKLIQLFFENNKFYIILWAYRFWIFLWLRVVWVIWQFVFWWYIRWIFIGWRNFFSVFFLGRAIFVDLEITTFSWKFSSVWVLWSQRITSNDDKCFGLSWFHHKLYSSSVNLTAKIAGMFRYARFSFFLQRQIQCNFLVIYPLRI